MYISQLRVSGFHSLDNISIDFQPGLNVLVGKNNAGKSNIIRAIDYILGEKWPTYQEFDDHCFYRDRSKQASEIIIIAKLSGSHINEDAIEDPEKKIKTIFNQSPDFDCLRKWISDIDNSDQRGNTSWVKCQDIASRLEQSDQKYIFLTTPRGSRKSERNFGLIFYAKELWHYCPIFPADLREALLTTAYIPSFRDPFNQLRCNQYSWYGKLIRGIYNKRTADQKTAITDAQARQATILGDVFRDATSDLRNRLSRAVFHHEITFQSGANTSDDEYKQITMFVDDGINAPFYEKGSGIQSALILGLFSFYCQEFHKGSSLLLVEEPEIYLHPQARRAIESQLVKFVSEGISQEVPEQYKHQVIISTHSPEFLRSVEMPNLCLVRKQAGQTASSVKQTQSVDIRSRQIIETKNAEMFFADHVILVEGGEEYILPPLANLVLGDDRETNCLDTLNVSVARVNGKGQFRAYTQLLNDLGIDWTILTDLDFLCNGIEHFSDLLDLDAKDALSRIREQWGRLQEQSLPKGKKIKENVFSPEIMDWQAIYREVDQAILDLTEGSMPESTRVEAIHVLWERLKQRVANSIDYMDLCQTSCRDLAELRSYLQSKRIFVLPYGDLESHLPEEALVSLSTQNKDRTALSFGFTLSEKTLKPWVEEWLDSPLADPFIKMLESVKTLVYDLEENSEPDLDESYLPF